MAVDIPHRLFPIMHDDIHGALTQASLQPSVESEFAIKAFLYIPLRFNMDVNVAAARPIIKA